jgi:membrane-associated protease RseP (regulator of RpoE activity)
MHGRPSDPTWRSLELENVTRQEAEALGWEAPRGAKVVSPVPGGLAEMAGLLPGDIIVSLDGFEIENAQHCLELLARKPADTEKIALAIRRDGREKRLVVKLGGRSRDFASLEADDQAPLPMLDAGGHIGQVRAIAYTPDGKQFVSAASDKTIRVWSAETGKTLRIIRGESAPGDWGQIYALALSPDVRWLAIGGYLHGKDRPSPRRYGCTTLPPAGSRRG